MKKTKYQYDEFNSLREKMEFLNNRKIVIHCRNMK